MPAPSSPPPAPAFFTAAAIRLAVSLGPDASLSGATRPVARSLMLLPPTSTTRTLTRAPFPFCFIARERHPSARRPGGEGGAGRGGAPPPRPEPLGVTPAPVSGVASLGG